MKKLKLLFVPFLCLFIISDIFSQSEKSGFIQLVSYGSWEQLAQSEQGFTAQLNKVDWPYTVYTEENVYTEKAGKWVRVYLRHNGWQPNELLRTIKASSFNSAFHKSNVDFTDLTDYRTAVRMHEGKPSQYSIKGITAANTSGNGPYKIQLGVFTEMKSNDYIANSYGFSKLEKDNIHSLLSYDFTKIKNKVCRRYFYGNFDSKAEAEAKRRILESRSKNKLLVVKTRKGKTQYHQNVTTSRPSLAVKSKNPYIYLSEDVTINSFDFFDCANASDEEYSCSCAFNASRDYYSDKNVFVWDWDQSACIKINGQMLHLTRKYFNYENELKKLAKTKYWYHQSFDGETIGDMTTFGQPSHLYAGTQEELFIDVLLAMDKMPYEIPISIESEGNTAREYYDETDRILNKAKALKRQGEKIREKVLFSNGNVNVFLTYKKITNYEGEANKYDGVIEIRSKSGTLYKMQKIKGTCGC